MRGGEKITITDSSSNKNSYLFLFLALLALVALFYLINNYYNKKNKEQFSNNEDVNSQSLVSSQNQVNEKFEDFNSVLSDISNASTGNSKPLIGTQYQPNSISKKKNTMKDVVLPNNISDNNILSNNQYPEDEYPKDKLSPAELLPADANSKWALVNPQGQGELCDQNFLEAGFHIGTNTVGQTLRNPNLQLRSEPPNPQIKVSPWMQSTMEADVNRRGLEIGSC